MTTICSAPAHARSPSTSSAHCAWENGSLPSLRPQPRASNTITRNHCESGPNVARGSSSEPIPPPPWWAISTGASSAPSTSTSSSLPLIVTRMP